jgi:hypothetical protein
MPELFYIMQIYIYYSLSAPTAGGPARGNSMESKLAPNGRLYAKQGRGQPGRAPCLGGAARRSAAKPRGALGY